MSQNQTRSIENRMRLWVPLFFGFGRDLLPVTFVNVNTKMVVGEVMELGTVEEILDVSEVSSEMGARWRDQICDDGLDIPKCLCDEVS